MKIGLIGAGYWGPNLIRNLKNNPRCELVKVSDVRSGRLEYINGLYPELETTLCGDDIINDKSIDSVVIATPAKSHKELALSAIINNKHVFIEKPLTDNYADAIEIVETAKKYNKIVAVGHIFQFTPAVTAIKDNLKLTGELYHFTSQRINLGPPNAATDVVWDLAPHDLSILLYLFGENPDKITAFGESRWWKDTIDNAHIFLEFPSKRSAHIHVSWLSSNKVRKIHIFGKNGNFEYDETKDDENKVVFYDKGVDNRLNLKESEKGKLQYGTGEIIKLQLVKGEPLALEINAFIDSVENNKAPINDGEIGKEVVRILETASMSIKEKFNV
jgi:predicted dehydrogenase